MMSTKPNKPRWLRRTTLAGSTAVTIAATAAAITVTSSNISEASPDAAVHRTPVTLVDDRAQSMAQVDRAKRWSALQERKRKLAKARKEAAARASRAAARRALLSADPRTVARAMLGRFGWGASQFGCLDALWRKESGWNLHAENPSSGAYGIPQALPGSKMASAGSDWRNNPITQISWGLGYIRSSYGSPCGAWAHSESSGWY
jgi:hypothetical protein